MEETAAIRTRLRRIEALTDAGASLPELLNEVRGLLEEGERLLATVASDEVARKGAHPVIEPPPCQAVENTPQRAAAVPPAGVRTTQIGPPAGAPTAASKEADAMA